MLRLWQAGAPTRRSSTRHIALAIAAKQRFDGRGAGANQAAAFGLVSNRNEPIRPPHVRTVHADAEDHEFLGNLELPISPFRILASVGRLSRPCALMNIHS
jgi:hypothetical protein